MTPTTKCTCACQACPAGNCTCAGNPARKPSECCCGPECTCGPDCAYPSSCGCLVDRFVAFQSALRAGADADKAEARLQDLAADRYGATGSVAQEPAGVLNDIEHRRGAEATSASREHVGQLQTTGVDLGATASKLQGAAPLPQRPLTWPSTTLLEHSSPFGPKNSKAPVAVATPP